MANKQACVRFPGDWKWYKYRLNKHNTVQVGDVVKVPTPWGIREATVMRLDARCSKYIEARVITLEEKPE